MYHEFFGLKQAPFKITPDTRMFFPGGNRGEILEALVYAISSGEGIVKVVGEVGSGKTMLCKMLEVRLPESIEIAYLPNPSLTPEDILHAIALELGLEVDPAAKRVHVMQALQQCLLQRHSANQRIVVFVEEAQAMPLDSLEEIRLLSNLETQQDKLLQIVLFGQPELDKNLNLRNIRQLRERITHSFKLPPFGIDDIQQYVRFRMQAVGYRGPDVFDRSAYSVITKASEGLTRRVNILADKCLLAAFAENTHNVGRRHAVKALVDSELGPRWAWRRPVYAAAAGLALAAGLGGWFWPQTLDLGATLRAVVAQTDSAPGDVATADSAQPAADAATTAPSDSTAGGSIQALATILDETFATSTPSAVAEVAAVSSANPSERGSKDTHELATEIAGAPAESDPEPPDADSRQMTPVPMQAALGEVETATAGAAGVEPAMAGVEPAMAEVEPAMAGVEPAMAGVEPAMAGVELAMAGVESAAAGVESAAAGVESAAAGVESAAAGVEPAAAEVEPTTDDGEHIAGELEPLPGERSPILASSGEVEPVTGETAPARVVGTDDAMTQQPTEVAALSASAVTVAEPAEAVATLAVVTDSPLVDQRLDAAKVWLEAANTTHFTIQLLLATDDRSLEEFLEGWQRAGRVEKTYIYRTVIGGVKSFGVLYDEYPTFSEAKAALATLPADVKRYKPFIRNVRDIGILG